MMMMMMMMVMRVLLMMMIFFGQSHPEYHRPFDLLVNGFICIVPAGIAGDTTSDLMDAGPRRSVLCRFCRRRLRPS